MLWILKIRILEVLRQALKISGNSLLMSHLKIVITLPLPQRSVITIFWKLLGHHHKDISWSSCPENSFGCCSVNKEVRNAYAVSVLGFSVLPLVSLADLEDSAGPAAPTCSRGAYDQQGWGAVPLSSQHLTLDLREQAGSKLLIWNSCLAWFAAWWWCGEADGARVL